jgi:hypothetical protein
MKCKNLDDKPLYHLYLRSFPLDEVVTEMSTPARRRELLSVLTREETLHYMKAVPALKNDRSFKGRALENDLGM